MTRLPMIVLTVALLSVGLTGCGGDDEPESAGASSSSSSTPASGSESPADDPAGGYPACEDVWVVGQQLPDGYEGCYDAERDTVEVAAAFVCADGSALTSYKDQWWALGDGKIAEAAEGTASNKDYAAAYSKCSP